MQHRGLRAWLVQLETATRDLRNQLALADTALAALALQNVRPGRR